MASRRLARWIPQQHGAWAWLLAPPLVGACLAGWTWRFGLFIIAWLAGYSAFNALSRWWRVPPARRRPWLTPLIVYGLVALLGGSGLCWSEPLLWRWIPPVAVLFAVPVVATWCHAERSWLNNLVTTLVACGMTVVAAGLTAAAVGRAEASWWPPGSDDAAAWLAALVLFAYFFGTVFYVRANFRGRLQTGPYVAAIIYHGVVGLAAVWLSWWLAGVGLLLLARAIVVPRLAKRLPAKYIGFGEFAATIIVSVVSVLVLG